MRNGPWSDDEMLRSLAFYASLTPEEKANLPKESISALVARLPRRTKGSVLMRIANFIARDPEMQAKGNKGLFGGGAHVDTIWVRFANEDGTLNLPKLLRVASTTL
jgi:hypothetical protein